MKKGIKKTGIVIFILIMSIIGIILIFSHNSGSDFGFQKMEEPLYTPNDFKTPNE